MGFSAHRWMPRAGSADVDEFVGDAVVEPVPGCPPVPEPVNLAGGLKEEVAEHVVAGFWVAAEDFVVGHAAGPGHRRVEGVERVVERRTPLPC